jgi:MoaA/NifB/PqqE/SkfB family radical SAM enzyme
MIDDNYLDLLDKNRNMVPILSIEGNADQTDGRRGAGVYATLMDAMSRLNKLGIFFGVSVTFTTENLSTITEISFVESLFSQGCKVVFFIEYVPVSSESRHLAPGDTERTILEERQSALRAKYPKMIFLSFPGDEKHTGGCLAAGRGFFHINANGDAEPCPFSPYSDSSVKDHTLLEILDSGLFRKISESGMLIGEHSGGCLLFEKEADVISMLDSSRK